MSYQGSKKFTGLTSVILFSNFVKTSSNMLIDTFRGHNIQI